MVPRILRPLLLVSLLMLAACASAETSPTTQAPTSTPQPSPTEAEPTLEPAAEPEADPTADPTDSAEIEAPVSSDPIDDDEALQLMYDFSNGSDEEAQAALARVLAAEDERFIPVLMEQFRGLQIGLVPDSIGFEEMLSAIGTLSGGAPPADNWFDLIEWYGTTDIVPPPGFTSWKGRMLSQIDTGFAEFLNDGNPSRIRVEEIQWGGVVVDGIPALNNPAMISAEEADYLEPDDVVFGLSINGESKAYPLRILDWHEMANDEIGGVPVSLAYCTLCGAAVAYDGRASDGETYTFGSSGFLFRSNKLMYDRQTRTLWNQLTGEPVLGDLAATDVTLDILPVVLTSWQDWQTQHPDTLVVDIDTGHFRNYEPGAAYAAYFAYDDTMFPVWQRSELLDAKSQIYAVRVNEVPKAYPIDTLVAEQVVNDAVGEVEVVLLAPAEVLEVTGSDQRSSEEVTYAAGAAVRAFERDGHTFALGNSAETLFDESGALWQVTEEALIGPNGEELPRLGGHLAYWFGWFAFFPDSAVYGVDLEN